MQAVVRKIVISSFASLLVFTIVSDYCLLPFSLDYFCARARTCGGMSRRVLAVCKLSQLDAVDGFDL